MPTNTLLIVEDSAEIVRRIREVVDTVPGIEVLGDAADSQTAIGMIAELDPDVVLVDLQLANNSNGFDVLNYLAKHELPTIAIVLSANVQHYRSLKRAFARAHRVLDKGMEFPLLAETLSNAIAGATSDQEKTS